MALEEQSEDHQRHEDSTFVMSNVLDWQTERQTSWQMLSSLQQNLICSAYNTHHVFWWETLTVERTGCLQEDSTGHSQNKPKPTVSYNINIINHSLTQYS